MFSIDLYEFSIELPKNSTPNLRFICPMFSGDPISAQKTVEGFDPHDKKNVV